MAYESVVEIDDDQERDEEFWQTELRASAKLLDEWHTRANKIIKRYLGEHINLKDENTFSLNLFFSNTKTIQDMLYSSLPKIEASRTNADSADDMARVAAEVIQRLLNLDIAANGEEYDSVLRSVLQDRLLPGLGCARVRYEVETIEVEVEATFDSVGFELSPATTVEKVVWEDAPIEYYHWQDVLWGWARNWSEIPWIAYRIYMTKSQIRKRFGEKWVDEVDFRKQKMSETTTETERAEDASPWMKAEVWEIWDKEMREVVWYSKGASKLLDSKTDPLKLKGFYPSPPFLIANITTNLYRPQPDFLLAQDLYNEAEQLQTRIGIITEAVKVVGVYDSSEEGIKRMLKEGVENDLIPIENWAMFAESGGLKGKIDWLPLKDVVDTLSKLQEVRDQTIQMLQMITGMSDVMQGALQSPYEGVGQSQMKVQFGSVRVQALQDQFARFAGDLLQLKAEVISKHFEPETIIKLSNMQFSEDRDLVPQAVELLKNWDDANIRIVVRPETVAMVDYARLKQERTEFLNAFSTLMQASTPMLEKYPESLPYVLKILQWAMAGFKGSQQIEGVLDKAIEGAIQKLNEQQEQPDPEQAAEQAKLQADLEKIKAKAQADIQTRQADLQADMQTIQATSQAKMGEIAATHHARTQEISQKSQADLIKEQAGLKANLMQIQYTAEAETDKDITAADIDIMVDLEKAQTELIVDGEKSAKKIDEIAVASAFKIEEMITAAREKPKPGASQDG